MYWKDKPFYESFQFGKEAIVMRIWQHHRLAKRIISGLMAVMVVVLVPMSALARTAEEVRAEQAQLELERQNLQARLEQLRADEEQKQAYQETLQAEIDILENQIDTARRDIEELNASINELNLKLEASQAEIADTLQQFRERVVALYKAGSVSTLEILLDANSFSDFSMRSEMLTNMSRRDQDLIDKITEYMDATKDEREECEAQKETVASLKKDMEKKQGELDELYKENAAAIAELQGAQYETNHALELNADEMAARDNELQQLIEQERKRQEEERKRQEEERKRQEEAAANNGGNANGYEQVQWVPDGSTNGVEGFNPTWPLPGVTLISDEFGGARNHGGMDIAGGYGTPIVAAESGTVIRANSTDEWGQGWGYHVYIYHNGTYSTLYAHMSSVAATTGQSVTKGQVIGYVGNTGNSFGPHLHFEVWQNGVRVNPRSFLF